MQLLEKRSDSEDEEAPVFMDSIEDGQTASADEWIAHMDVNGTEVSLKLDTGAQVNILPMKDFQSLRKKKPCFLRLPFGISLAPKVFHKTMQQLFDGIE